MITLYDRPVFEDESEWRAELNEAYTDAVNGFIKNHPEFAPIADAILDQAKDSGMDPEDITAEAIENALAELSSDTFDDDDLYRLTKSDLEKVTKHPDRYRPLRVNDCPRVFIVKK